jgi:crotonobetainyl-CoA:carnitine CoA-transferase CaiB-like acyl-CoA transferase
MNAPLRDSESDNPHAAQALPLAGMKVLDLSRALSGPFCSMILGDLGADVVKVEPMPKGDMIRTWGPFDRDQSAYFLSGNRNKRAIAIDFRTPDGIAILRELALKSDVIVENFLPGTLEAMTLGADRLRVEKPAIIVASISGFGKGGPLGDRPGFDQIAQGFSGFMSVTGTAETGPTRVGVAIGDMASGMWLAIGVLGAWIERGRSGCGQTVETSLLASLIGLLSVQGQRYLSLGEVASPSGNVHPVIAPYGVFRAADGDMNIGAATQDMWLKLCDVLERPDLKADPRFTLNADRMGHRDALRDIIETELARRTRREWTDILVAARIPAGPINSIADALQDEQVLHQGLIETVEHPTLGPLRQVSNPLKMAAAAGGWVRTAPPLFGQHTDEVLEEFGFSADQRADWRDRKLIFQA